MSMPLIGWPSLRTSSAFFWNWLTMRAVFSAPCASAFASWIDSPFSCGSVSLTPPTRPGPRKMMPKRWPWPASMISSTSSTLPSFCFSSFTFSALTSVAGRPARRSVTLLPSTVQKLARAATSPAFSSMPMPTTSMTPRPISTTRGS